MAQVSTRSLEEGTNQRDWGGVDYISDEKDQFLMEGHSVHSDHTEHFANSTRAQGRYRY